MNDVKTRFAGPDLGQMLPRMREIGPAKSWTEAGEQARAEWDAPYGPAEQWDLRVEDRQAPGPHGPVPVRIYTPTAPADAPRPVLRSEEHTSELQSRGHIVSRLLLDKRKTM